MANAEPKFINPSDIPVTVFNEQKRMLTVHPHRESNPGVPGAVYEVEGKHYAQFALQGVGPLAPFRENEKAPEINTSHPAPAPTPKNYPRPDSPVQGVPSAEAVAAGVPPVGQTAAEQNGALEEAFGKTDDSVPGIEAGQNAALADAFGDDAPGTGVHQAIPDDGETPEPQDAPLAMPNTPVTADHDAAIAAAFGDDEDEGGEAPAPADTTEEAKPKTPMKRGGLKSKARKSR